jgi:hypothetical protein
MSPPISPLRSFRKVTPRNVLLVAMALFAMIGLARGGHEVPVYPSYYPHEIRVETMPPERAAELLRDAKLHAYLGPEPRFPGALPQSVRAVESLGNFVFVRINPGHVAQDERAACEIVEAIIRDMAARDMTDRDGFVFHPYPVTPFDGDYLDHVDRAETEKTRLSGEPATLPRELRVKVEGMLAGLVRPEWRAPGTDWDAAVEEASVAELVTGARNSLNGWLGPAWVKTGWFHAERLLADATGDTEARQRTEAIAQRLESGDYRDPIERVNLERELVAALNLGCRKRIAGYTIKRQYFSAEFTNGIENIGFDSIEGFNSPVFIRTVKLKDFPWNGWLNLGIDAPPEAAWNPIAGFSDRFGRLLWSAIGDPALFSAPYDSGWMLNRIADVQSNPGR